MLYMIFLLHVIADKKFLLNNNNFVATMKKGHSIWSAPLALIILLDKLSLSLFYKFDRHWRILSTFCFDKV